MGGWYLFEFIIDLYYWVDFVMCFHTAYWEKMDDGDDVRYVTNLEEIRAHYLRTWFLFDLLAILPVEYIKRNAQNIAVCSWSLVNDPCGDHVVKGVDHHVMRAFTVIRLFRLLKLGHLPRVQRIIFGYFDEFILQYHLFFSMSKLLLSLMFISHWMACLYGSQYNFEREDHSGVEGLHWEMYIGAVYWAVQTVTTVGYGNIVPTTISERVIACFVMLLGGFVFSTIISKVASVLEPDSSENIEVRRKLALRRFIEEKKIPRSLIVRINTYYKNEKDDSFGNNEVIARLPDVIRTDVNYFVYGGVIIDAFSGTIMPNEMFVEFMCRRMYPKRYTRDMPLSMTNEFVENIFIVAEGRVAVAAREEDLLEDTGDVDTKAYNEKISDANYDNDDPGAGCLMPPGALINPGVALGYKRGVLCTRPYDKIVNLMVLVQAGPDGRHRGTPTSARAQRDGRVHRAAHVVAQIHAELGLEGIGRMNLWDEENKRVKAKWDVILQQERRKEDEARLSRGGSLADSQDDDDAIVEAPKLIEAEIGGDKFELVQKQVQQQSIVLAQVANSFKESTEKTRDKLLGEQNADLKKFQNLGDRRAQVALAPHRAHRGRDRGPPQAPRGADGRLALRTPRRARTQLASALDRLPIRTWPRRRTTCGWAGGRTRVSPGRGGTRRLRRRGAQRRRRGRRQRSKAQVRRGRVGERQAGVEVVAAAPAARVRGGAPAKGAVRNPLRGLAKDPR